jgi:hypothetical protein
MRNASDYLAHIKTLIIIHSQVKQWSVVREEAQGRNGLFRYRLILKDDSLLEMFERFHINGGQVFVTKYSFHWQDTDGNLLKRWDNVAHHPEIETYPHPLHDGEETNVQSHKPISTEQVLNLIAQQLQYVCQGECYRSLRRVP